MSDTTSDKLIAVPARSRGQGTGFWIQTFITVIAVVLLTIAILPTLLQVDANTLGNTAFFRVCVEHYKDVTRAMQRNAKRLGEPANSTPLLNTQLVSHQRSMAARSQVQFR